MQRSKLERELGENPHLSNKAADALLFVILELDVQALFDADFHLDRRGRFWWLTQQRQWLSK
jgi:hypothetical protein